MNIYKQLLTIAFGVALACVVAETGLRWLGFAKTQFITYDQWRGWSLKPGAAGWQKDEGRAWVRINRWGYRGPDWTLKKPPHTVRVAVIGDSFTEAQQVAEGETFTAVAERVLNQTCAATIQCRDIHFEFLNFGVDGYGTAQELMTLRHDVWKFDPDVVILAFFAGNDFRNNSVTLEGDQCQPFFVERNGAIVPGGPFLTSRAFRFSCFMRFESRHSQLLNVLGSAKSRLRWRLRNWTPSLRRSRRAPPSGHEPGLNDQIYHPPVDRDWREAWRITEAEIEMIHQETLRHRAIFLLVTLSTGIQDSPNPAVRVRYLKSVDGTSLFYPEQQLDAWSEEKDFPVLNLAPPMQQYAMAHHVYLHGFPNTRMGSGHWNQTGHQLAGELIAQKVFSLIVARNRLSIPARNSTLKAALPLHQTKAP